jgi:tetratricopeptide (TPR) repeat protein
LSDRLAGARGQLSASLYVWSARDQMSRLSRRLPVALRVGDWTTVLAMLDDAKLADRDTTTNLRFLKEELRNFGLGMRALDQGDLASAEAASVEMDAGLWRRGQDLKAAAADKSKADAEKAKSSTGAAKANAAAQPVTLPLNPDAMAEPLMSSLSVASTELRAGVLLLQGKTEPARKMYAQAVLAEKKLGYHEPPFYIRPVAETEAEALVRAKDYAGAKKAYQEALAERPASGFELYGMARADELAGNTADAKTEYRAFLKAWPSADPGLPQLLHARDAVGETGSVAAQ